MTTKQNPWTPELIDKLTSLWLSGLSAAEIAETLGPKFTRNSVMGKIHRFGLRRQGRPAMPRRPKTVSKPFKPFPAKPTLRLVKKPTADPVGIYDLKSHHCRWPVGSKAGADQMFCGDVALPGKPYCLDHHEVAFAKRVKMTREEVGIAFQLKRQMLRENARKAFG